MWQVLSKDITTGKYFWHGTEITEAEYEHIKSIIANRPTPPEGYGYRLTDVLEWELYEVPATEEEDEELTDEQALEILLGGAV